MFGTVSRSPKQATGSRCYACGQPINYLILGRITIVADGSAVIQGNSIILQRHACETPDIRITRGLKAAGKAGLTIDQIRDQIFDRNFPEGRLRATLDLMRQAKTVEVLTKTDARGRTQTIVTLPKPARKRGK